MVSHLQNELRQTRPFGTVEQEAYLNIVRTAALLADSLELALRPAGTTPAQYNVLRILRGAEPQGLCRNDLRSRLINRMPDVTRLLDRMERAGLVSRTRDDEDRRLVTTRITRSGRSLLDRLDSLVAEEHRRQLGHMKKQDLVTLNDLLSRVRHVR